MLVLKWECQFIGEEKNPKALRYDLCTTESILVTRTSQIWQFHCVLLLRGKQILDDQLFRYREDYKWYLQYLVSVSIINNI